MVYVSEIFKGMNQWGLRGDPLFWEYMASYFAEIAAPYPTDRLEKDIHRLFEELTQETLHSDKIYFVSRFADEHKGMSTGHLSGRFWVERGIPFLLGNLEDLNNRIIKQTMR